MTGVVGIEMAVIDGSPDYYCPAVAGSNPSGRFVEVLPFKVELLSELASQVLTSCPDDRRRGTSQRDCLAVFGRSRNGDR